MAPELLECEAHGTPTRLRCAEAGCDKPICPQCLVKTSVGLKCQEHAQVIAPKFDRRAQRSVIGAVALVAVAVVIGAAFGSVITALVEDLITPIIAGVSGIEDRRIKYPTAPIAYTSATSNAERLTVYAPALASRRIEL